jgi:hypothetical protein
MSDLTPYAGLFDHLRAIARRRSSNSQRSAGHV